MNESTAQAHTSLVSLYIDGCPVIVDRPTYNSNMNVHSL